MHIGEGGKLLADLVIRQRIIHDGVFRDVREGNVFRDVVQVGPVVLPHQEELAAVPEDSRANSALLEPGVLLDDGDVPTIELSKLRVTFSDDVLAAWNVEEPGDFFVNVAFSQCSREGNDVLSRVIGDEETSSGFEFLCRIWNVAKLEVSDFTRQLQVADAIE